MKMFLTYFSDILYTFLEAEFCLDYAESQSSKFDESQSEIKGMTIVHYLNLLLMRKQLGGLAAGSCVFDMFNLEE